MSRNKETGILGERAACNYLINKGHKILFCNYRIGNKEIDIISMEKDILIFSEIKTRNTIDFGFPEEAVSFKKQNHIKEAAEVFLNENRDYTKLRFDVISIVLYKGKVKEILHFEDAFY